MRKIYAVLTAVVLGLAFNINAAPMQLSAQPVQSIGALQPAPPDSIVQLTAEAQGLALVAPADLPKYGTYWLVMPGIGGMAPLPCPPDDPSLPVYQIADGQFLVDATGGQVAVNPRRFGLQATSSTVASALAAEADAGVNLINQVQAAQFNRELAAVMGFDEELDSPDTFSPMLAVYDTNLLWLEITNVSNGWSYLNLHNATNQVYAIWSTTNLLTSWNVETELWPTNGAVMPFTVPTLDRQNLFVRAEDWTSIDSNGDGIPDWWVWLYFGNLNETATNLDSQGNTLGYDYTNGLDPNIIQFFLVVTNRHVSTTFAPMQFNITAGVPSSLAVLVNSTNFSGAAWTGYSSSNVVVSLGSTDGDYNVWVGLRGRVTNSQQLWQGVTFTLDRVSPTVVITNPALTTVSKPVIQLQGYVSEPLASLTYDLTNAAGRITNQPAYIIGQFVDTNTWKFTTNYFQCYDVALTNGANLITLHALDLAGNTTTVNTTLTLDYSGATNPPAITLTWPTTNSVIAGTSFTLQGLLDDDTATVTVSGLGTNKFTGLVERGGRFTVPNLPLPNLTNVLTIAATNAAGHGRTVPLTALKR